MKSNDRPASTSAVQSSGTRAAQKVRAMRRRNGSELMRVVCELCEPRMLLAANLRTKIPASITPSTVAQTLLGPGVNTFSQTSSSNATAVSSNFRFSLNNASADQLTSLTTRFTSGTSVSDSAIAIYDNSGNRIFLQDLDNPAQNNETLQINLQSGVVYTAEFFGIQMVGGSTTLSLQIDTGPQKMGTTLSLDPATHGAVFTIPSGADGFSSPSDVRYFPLDLFNTSSGSFNLSPSSPDTAVKIDVYLQTSPSNNGWTQWASQTLPAGQGGALELILPPSGGVASDGNYVVAVAPLNFAGAAQPLQINASFSGLAPTTVSPASATSALTEALTAPGTLAASVSGSITAGTTKLYSVIAPVSGQITINSTGGFPKIFGAYGPGGTNLLAVTATTNSSTQVSRTFNVTAGTQYFIYVGGYGASDAGSFTITASQTVASPTAVTVAATLGQQATQQIGPTSGGKLFRLSTPVGSNFLALQIAPDGGSTLMPTISVVGSDGVVKTVTAASAGAPATLILDQSSNAGPYDVFVTSPTGTGTASLKYASVVIPNAPSVGQYATSLLNFSNGGLTSAITPVITGTPVGLQYFQPSNGTGATNTTFAASVTNTGAAVILLHYVQDGTTFHLIEQAAPSVGGNSANLFVPVRGQALHALVALPVNFSGSGAVVLTVGGPKPKGVGLQTVPNAVPGAGPPAGGYQSIASLQNGKLNSLLQRDLYSVQVPFNASSTTTTLTYTPNQTNGPLTVKVSVLDANNNLITSQTSSAGGSLSIPISGLVPGQAIRFEIDPIAGSNIGDGAYKLSTSFATTNPLPYLVTQPFFYPFTSSQVAGRSYFPSGVVDATIPTIPLNGSQTSSFTSSTPYNNNGTGSIKVFKITGWTDNSPMTVQTTDLDSNINTNIALFYLGQDDSGNVAYRRLAGSAPSFDYYPADRTLVDSKIVVNNTDLDPLFSNAEIGGGPITVYAVVMNEQGTQGSFKISANQPTPPVVTGPGNTTPANIIVAAPRTNPEFISNLLTTQTANGTTFAVRTPSDMNSNVIPTITINTINHSVGQTITVQITRNQIINVGTVSGVVAGNGTVTIPIQGTVAGSGQIVPILGANSAYTFTVTASSFPSGGMTLGLNVTYATGTGTVPSPTLTSGIPTDAGYNSSIKRMRPSPTGAISETAVVSGGVFGSIFTLTKAGAVSFTINSASTGAPAVGLYRAGKSPTSPYTDRSILIDWDNTRTSNNFVVAANLQPGTYWLRGQSFDTSPITITGTVPAATTQVLEVEPSTGLTQQSEQTIINKGAFGSTSGANNNGFSATRYGSNFFELVVPSNTNGQPISFSLFDATGYTFNLPNPPVGTATLTMYKFENGVYTRIASTPDAVTSSTHSATISANEPAVAGAQYFVGVDFNAFQYAAYVGFTVPIFTTGVGDFAVQPITLAASSGSTLVQSSILNGSFSSTQAANYTLQLGGTTVTRAIPTLAPFGSFVISQLWQPGAASDVVTIVANPTHAAPETTLVNNSQTIALSTVDAAAPTAQISLQDANMTAEGNAAFSTGGGTWGRYIAGVSGQTSTVLVKGHDDDHDIYQLVAYVANPDGTHSLDSFKAFYTTGTTDFTSSIPFDFGTLKGTTTTNLNQLKFYAMDSFGLKTPTFVQLLDVAATPGFLMGGVPAAGVMGAGGTITFNRSTRQFAYSFQDSIISVSKTLSDLMGLDVPVVGDKNNEFLVSITGTGTGGLNPNIDVPLSLSGHAKLTAMDQSLFDKTVNGTQTSGAITFRTQMTLAGRSLVPSSASVSLQVANLQLLNYESPRIPIVSIGLPGVAEVSAGIKFGLKASLNAGAKLGLDPLAGSVGGYLGSLGVMSPTFIQPTITGTATVSGDISVLGFDIADLSGSVSLTLTITMGLDNNVPGAIISFADAPSNFGVRVDATVKIHVAAHVFLLGDVYTYDSPPITGTLVNTITKGIFTTDPPSLSNMVGPSGRRGGAGGDDVGDPVIKNGSSVVGGYEIDPSPQIVINNSVLNGMGLSVQLVNAGTAAAPLANLQFTNRSGGVWSALTTLPGANDIADPNLALTHDGSGTPGVVVYNADKVAGSPATQTFNQRLTSEEIRYRYFNGTTWGAEQSLTNDSLYDSQSSTAFNAAGEGVLAYVHNNNATPMSGTGQLDAASNDIYAAIWNPFTHSFGAPLVVTSAAGSDSSPTTYVDANNKRYVMWIHTESGVSQLMYSTNTGSGWSPQAALNVTGLAAGGSFTNVALGSDGANRIDVIFSYVQKNADGTLSTTLYHRPSTVANFGTAQSAAQIAANSTFSGLKVTNAPSGALVAYWQQSDGESNQIVESTITNGVAMTPTQISDSPNIAKRPSAAVDGDGKVQLMYYNSTMYGGTSQGTSSDPTVGAPTAAGVGTSSVSSLPQLTFTQGLAFPVESQASAPIGSIINGTAVVTNRGLASGTFTVTAYRGIPGSGGVAVGTPFSVTLAPGASYNITQPFTVVAGDQTYSLQVTTAQQQAFNNTTENLTSATLKGLGDLSVNLQNDVSFPSPGSAQALHTFITNNSTAAVGPFDVQFYQGDPLSPQSTLTPIGSPVHVSGIAAGSGTDVILNVTLPATAGDYIYSAYIDSGKAVEESNENNNYGRYEVKFLADPAVVTAADGTPPVVATLVNSGTSNNVSVTVNVANLGATDMVNVPVNLRVSRNNGAFVNLGQQVIPTLAVGQQVTLTFTVTSLGGENVYVAAIDNSINGADVNLGNNVGTTTLIVPGLAALNATATLSSGTTVAGSPLSLIANLSNSGLADVVDVPLVVIATLSGGATYTIGSGTISLAGLGSGSTSISLNTASLPGGSYTVTLQVDPNQTVLQSTATPDFSLPLTVVGSAVLTAAAEYLRLNADGLRLDIWDHNAPTGNPDRQIVLSTIGSLSSSGSSSGQIIHVDFSNGNPFPASGLAFNGSSAGFNSLDLIGTSGVDTFTVNAGSVVFTGGTVTGATVTRANLNKLTITGNGGTDNINLSTAGANPLPSDAAINGTFNINGFQNLNGTTLDFNRSTAFIKYTPGNDPVALVRQALVRGYNTGTWNGASAGTGAIFSTPAIGATALTGLGYVDSADTSGINTTPNSIMIKYSLRGDATLDGVVNFNDLVQIAQNYNQVGGHAWDQGDLNYDGTVNFSDLVILAQEYNQTLGSLLVAPPSLGGTTRQPTIDQLLARLPVMFNLPTKAPKGYTTAGPVGGIGQA